jgi:hypothetical protein
VILSSRGKVSSVLGSRHVGSEALIGRGLRRVTRIFTGIRQQYVYEMTVEPFSAWIPRTALSAVIQFGPQYDSGSQSCHERSHCSALQQAWSASPLPREIRGTQVLA